MFPRRAHAHTHTLGQSAQRPHRARLSVGVATCGLAEKESPRSIKGIGCRSPGLRGSRVWIRTRALHPTSLCPSLRNRDSRRPLALCAKAAAGQWPRLTAPLATGAAGRGREGAEAGREPHPGRGRGCSWSPDRMQAVVRANPGFIGPSAHSEASRRRRPACLPRPRPQCVSSALCLGRQEGGPLGAGGGWRLQGNFVWGPGSALHGRR